MAHNTNVSNWQKENPDKTNAKQRRYNKKLKIDALQIIGKSCICCGVSEWWNLSIDHIKPIDDRRENSHNIYRDLRLGKLNNLDFQTLCHGCNNSKNAGMKCNIEH